MKKIRLYILLFVVLVMLIIAYITVRYNNIDKQDNYKLNSKFYLEKIDYFSKYSIVKKSDNDYITIITNIEAISILKDSYLIKFKEKSILKYLYLDFYSEEYIITDNINDFDKSILLQEIIWKKPWQIVEIKTLNNPIKLISQILLILIIILSFYITMKIFNLKKIKKSP